MKRQRVGGLVLSLILAASSYGSPQDAGMTETMNEGKITIRVHNYAQVNPSVLIPATRAAADILQQAGVESVWVECGQTESPDAACTSPVTPLDLVLNLLPRSQAKKFHFRDEIFGVAFQTVGEDFGVYASVFYDNVKTCAAQRKLDLAPLLGYVIAHELAHLLLGPSSHSSHGVMRDSWSGKELLAAEQRGLSFSSSEKKRLQITLTARTLAVLNGAVSPESLPIANTKTNSAAAMK
jgi:hypothetical protein